MSDIEHEHLTKEILERYFAATQSEEAVRMLLHLLAVCPRMNGSALLRQSRTANRPTKA